MANIPPIQFKRSDILGKIPDSDQLAVGELAINFADKTLYTKDSDGNVFSVGGGGGGPGGILALDSEGVLNSLDSDEIKHKESLVYLIDSRRIIAWDSEGDVWRPVTYGASLTLDVVDSEGRLEDFTTKTDGMMVSVGDYTDMYYYTEAGDKFTRFSTRNYQIFESVAEMIDSESQRGQPPSCICFVGGTNTTYFFKGTRTQSLTDYNVISEPQPSSYLSPYAYNITVGDLNATTPDSLVELQQLEVFSTTQESYLTPAISTLEIATNLFVSDSDSATLEIGLQDEF